MKTLVTGTTFHFPLLGVSVGFMKGRQLAAKPFHLSLSQNPLVTLKRRQLKGKGFVRFSM